MSDSTMTINIFGSKVWENSEGENHRTDGPAVERANGDKEWWVNGELHREDGPAVERANGDKEWRVNGKLHRKDGPAIEQADGYKSWCRNGKLHRKNGPAVVRPNGDKFWYVNDRFLGFGDKGFWALWEILTDKQKKNFALLSHLPGSLNV